MKKIIIDGKEYLQQEDSDISKLPYMSYPKDLLTHCQTCKNELVACVCLNDGKDGFSNG
jgi:hypothetical protein